MVHWSSKGVVILVALILLSAPWLKLNQSATGGAVEGSQTGTESSSPVSSFLLPQAGAYPLGVATDSRGNVWFAEDNSDAIVEFIPTNATFRTFHIPMSPHLAWIWFLIFVNGELWFSDESQPYLWSFSPTTHSFSNFTADGADPFSLAYDQATSRIWFTSLLTDQIGYFQVTGETAAVGRLANLTTLAQGEGPADIVVGSGGALYVSETFLARIVEVNSSSLAVVRTWQLPQGSEPVGLALDPQTESLWFTNHASSYFGYVELAPGGGYRELSTSPLFDNGTYWVTLPYWIAVGPGGYIWFDEHAANKIARFDPATMQLTEFPISTPNSAPLRFAVDENDGILWFTEFAGNNLGELELNSSLSQSVTLSSTEQALNPSATFQASASPPAAGPPVLGFTGTVTGAAAPGFSASSVASGNGYDIKVGLGEAAPGNYSSSVCFDYNTTSQCAYVALSVPEPLSAAPIIYALYVGLAALVLILVVAVRREYFSKKPVAVPGAASSSG